MNNLEYDALPLSEVSPSGTDWTTTVSVPQQEIEYFSSLQIRRVVISPFHRTYSLVCMCTSLSVFAYDVQKELSPHGTCHEGRTSGLLILRAQVNSQQKCLTESAYREEHPHVKRLRLITFMATDGLERPGCTRHRPGSSRCYSRQHNESAGLDRRRY